MIITSYPRIKRPLLGCHTDLFTEELASDLLQTRSDGRGGEWGGHRNGRGGEWGEHRKGSVSHEPVTVEVKPPFSDTSNLHPLAHLHVLGTFHNKMFENTYYAPGTRLALTSAMNLHHRKTQSEPFPLAWTCGKGEECGGDALNSPDSR